jgi:DNA-binding GntR family transcriptional regulator
VRDDVTVRYRTATEHAFITLKRWITAGVLAPGASIDQAELSQRLGMSRVPVRTALERLASEGLVALTPRRGAVVMPLSLQEMSDLYVVRHHLEGLATELAADRLTEADVEALARILAQTEEEVRRGDLEAFLASNRAFHMRIYAASGNAVLTRVIGGLWDLSERYRRAYLQLPARAEESTAEHRHIFDLLRARRGAEAAAFMREHNAKTMRVLAEYYGREGSGA